MKRVLVTGAGGFVGANLVRRLLVDGHELALFVRPGSDQWRNKSIQQHARVLEIDLGDAGAVAAAVQSVRAEWIFHLAAYGAYPSQADPSLMVRTNIVGTVNLVRACLELGFDALVNTGSSSEYGFKGEPAAETDRLDPNSHYAWTKAAATHFCQHMARTCGANIPTLRLYSVFGPFEEPTRLMPSLIVRGMKGEFPPMAGPKIARDFVYVDDVCDAYIKAVTCSANPAGGIYNVGSGVQTSLGRLVQLLKAQFRIENECQWGTMPRRSWDTDVWVADINKARNELAWMASHTLEEGLNCFIDWFNKNPEMILFYERRGA